MDIGTDERPERAESIVPMINVVFLLLIFFLMTATIAPPEPFEIEVPDSAADSELTVDRTLFVAPDGKMQFDGETGDAMFAALAGAGIGRADAPPLIVRADRRAPAQTIAGLMTQLGSLGITNAQLMAAQR